MVAVHDNTGGKKEGQNVKLRSQKGIVTILFMYFILYNCFYVTIFKRLLYCSPTKRVRTNRSMDNKGIFKKVTKKQEHLTASLAGSTKQVSTLVLLSGLFSHIRSLYL